MGHSDEIGSPGLGTSYVKLSKEPLATEGEATSGPDSSPNDREIRNAQFGVAPEPRLDVPDNLDPPAPDFGPSLLPFW